MKNVADLTAVAVPAQGGSQGVDAVTLGQRIRHLRRARGMTLAGLAARVGAASSALSTIENGRREPRLSLLQAIAGALEVSVEDLLRTEPPSRRAALEIALEHAQREPSYASLGLP
ncbi:MAG TPA: helix-turn-helix transcriptional regulator, partial [Mycobacteriales bacterium]|nr:helix-turn-helix transcriptional regulator [Mycobacteriales bacterium]